MQCQYIKWVTGYYLLKFISPAQWWNSNPRPYRCSLTLKCGSVKIACRWFVDGSCDNCEFEFGCWTGMWCHYAGGSGALPGGYSGGCLLVCRLTRGTATKAEWVRPGHFVSSFKSVWWHDLWCGHLPPPVYYPCYYIACTMWLSEVLPHDGAHS